MTEAGADRPAMATAASAATAAPVRPVSLRRYLLIGILVPVLAVVAVNTASLYRQALRTVNTAYDRTLLASAKTIGEQLGVQGYDELAIIQSVVPYSALEAFEADNQSRMFYRVSRQDGEMVSGFPELPFWRGTLPDRNTYAALVDFYDEQFRGEPVRVAVLLQPVASSVGRGMAVIQVAETLELRQTLARRLLFETLWRQLLLIVVIAAVTIAVVQRATRPVRQLSERIRARAATDLTPIAAPGAPRELLPLVDATNQVMQQLQRLLDQRKRFVRDASHQLRTPLAVLKVQLQSAQRGDVPAQQALAELGDTVERATQLANQMLALARVEQLRQQPPARSADFAEILRDVALDLSPLIAERDLDFEIDTRPAPVRADAWMLRELARNLLHNAIKHSPPAGALLVRLAGDGEWAMLTILDSGPGIDAELAQRLYQPFSAGDTRHGSGLGLAICLEIVQALGGRIALENRLRQGLVTGLEVRVDLPLAHNEAT